MRDSREFTQPTVITHISTAEPGRYSNVLLYVSFAGCFSQDVVSLVSLISLVSLVSYVS